jgi:hypothetical protein
MKKFCVSERDHCAAVAQQAEVRWLNEELKRMSKGRHPKNARSVLANSAGLKYANIRDQKR